MNGPSGIYFSVFCDHFRVKGIFRKLTCKGWCRGVAYAKAKVQTVGLGRLSQ